jgi:uncharacterized protein (TIGR02246 family)
MSKMILTLTAASALALAACSPAATTTAAPAVDTAAIASAIRAGEAQWNADWVARDAAKIASHYAPDAVLMVPGIPVINGRDAVQAALNAGPLADQNFSLTFHAEDVQAATSGDVAYSRGVYEEHDTNARTHHVDVSTGSYVTVYRKQADGSWLAVADINTPQPSAGASPEPAHP